MIKRILLAVDDTAASMTATEQAIDLAARLGAQIRAVSVVANHAVGERLTALTRSQTVAQRRAKAATAILRHVARLGAEAGVPVQTVLLEGQPASHILAQARSWPADLVVVGHASRHGPGHPFVGAQTQHVLEFSELPVLVIPAARIAAGRPQVPAQI